MAELAKLIRKRATIKGFFTRFQTALNALDQTDPASLRNFKRRCTNPQLFQGLISFNKIQELIEDTDPDNFDTHQSDRFPFEEIYYDLTSRAIEILQSHNLMDNTISDLIAPGVKQLKVPSERPSSSHSRMDQVRDQHKSVPSILRSQSSHISPHTSFAPGMTVQHVQESVNSNAAFIPAVNQTNHSLTHNQLSHCKSDQTAIFHPSQLKINNIKLPSIKLPTFSGDYDKWLNFRDSFKALVHDNDQILPVIKFHHLLSLLSGEPQSIIQSIPISNSNYQIAWQLLVRRYEQEGVIIDNHIKSIIEIDPIQRESHSNLQLLTNILNANVRALRSLGEPVEAWSTILIYILKNKFDQYTKREWAEYTVKLTERPSLLDLLEFLQYRCQLLESLLTHQRVPISRSSNPRAMTGSLVSHITNDVCQICNKKPSHPIFYCQKFLQLSPSQRYKKTKELQLCSNCFSCHHSTKACQSKNVCRNCNKKHNTLLHFSSSESTNSLPVQETVPASNEERTSLVQINEMASSGVILASLVSRNQILLPSAVVYVFDNSNKKHTCRLLLDSCSQLNYVSQSCITNLNIKGESVMLPISGINNVSSVANQKVHLKLKSRFNNFSCAVSCFVLPTITAALPTTAFSKQLINLPQKLQLADPNFNEPNSIDMLLGAELFWQLLCIGQFSLGPDLPVCQKTHFGWVISGPISTPIQAARSTVNCLTSINEEYQLSQQLRAFWEIEESNNSISEAPEHLACESLFVSTTAKTNNRFVVRLPFKSNKEQLGESYSIARRRFQYLEAKFNRDPTYKKVYVDFMREYETLGHMSSVRYSLKDLQKAYFLPHHAVLKSESVTTKLRVVFDASSKTSTGVSLNDALMVGGCVQSDLFSILLDFRVHKYAFTSDCEKMYRQILIHPDDRFYQNIIWRENVNEPFKIFQLNTVTYGTASAPFLATRSLKQISIDVIDQVPKAAQLIKNNFYVDDLIGAVDNFHEAKQIITDINSNLKKYGFILRKWTSNFPDMLQNIQIGDTTMLFSDSEKTTKVLGLAWNAKYDSFSFPTELVATDTSVTKRVILSVTSRLFDPLGLVSPIIVRAKLIIQLLWQLNISWDESIPERLHSVWIQFLQDMTHVNKLIIPRFILLSNTKIIQLHGFADASELAYGACIYLRSSVNDTHVSSLLCSKTKVAPLKKITLPRLELCAALLLVRLKNKVLNALNVNMNECFFWSDSTITLAWISTSPHQLKPFVSNRVSEIIETTLPYQWHHISSQDNPADLPSRGTSPNKLANNPIWWHGPPWLNKNISQWPLKSSVTTDVPIPDLKPINCTLTSHTAENDVLDKLISNCSSLQKLKRVLAYVLRFINNVKPGIHERHSHNLSVEELNVAMDLLIKHVQYNSFNNELGYLVNNTPVPKNSNLLSLAPFLHKEIIRVGGRIDNANVSFNQRHPILLPNKGQFTDLIIKSEHYRTFHGGCQQVLSAVRLNFWPIAGMTAVKRALNSCTVCKRFNAKIYKPMMGVLPPARVTPSRPFSECGVDYAGPFLVKDMTRRCRKGPSIKAYLAIFVCFATKAVHVEVVSNLTTEAFINTLKRFIARRGICKTIHSDNGTNFVGAHNELSDWYKLSSSASHNNLVHEFCSNSTIRWKFIPARSPNFGGLWEAAVKSVKRHLLKITHNLSLTFEELITFATQIEAILNSRPLIPLSSNPSEFQALTPGHFLVGDSLMALPEPHLSNVPFNRLTRFQMLQHLHQQFWSHWSNDYLQLLQARTKCQRNIQSPIKIGSLVIVKDSTPPLCWRMGRVLDVHPGKDGIIRVATVKTSSSTVKRAITQLSELLTENT